MAAPIAMRVSISNLAKRAKLSVLTSLELDNSLSLVRDLVESVAEPA